MADRKVRFVALRKNPDLLEETANFLNAEWPISLAARLHYLAENKEDFPCSLILLQTEQQNLLRVIGHSRLNKVLGKPSAVFISCVLIEKAKRGCGFGKKLMKFTEAHASQLGCTAIYLSTTDKCKFYKHLGYQFCSQVSPVKTSSSVFTSSQLAILQGQSEEKKPIVDQDKEGNGGSYRTENFREKNGHLLDDHQSRQEISNPCDCGINSIGNHTKEHENILHDNDTSSSFSSSFSSSSSLPLLEETVSPWPPPPPPPPPPPTPPNPYHLCQPPLPHRTVLAVSFWMMKEI